MRIIEQGGECGSFWRGGHEHLSLHSPHHQLPHDGGLAHEYPMFKTKHEVREYVSRYASYKGLAKHISFGEKVLHVKHDPGGDAERPWRVTTDKRTHRARRVVVATGLNRKPHVPTIPGADRREGSGPRGLRHSWSVASCDEYRGERVLLVGSGNSSAELAVALHRAGAKSVDLLVDGPRHFVRRSTMGRVFGLFPYFGLSTESMVHELHRCTFDVDYASTDGKDAAAWERFQDGQDWFIRQLSVDLRRFGIRQPPPWREALASGVSPPRIPVYDIDEQRLTKEKERSSEGGPTHERESAAVCSGCGVIDLIQSGGVGVKVGRIRRFTSEGVIITEGSSRHAAPRAAAVATAASSSATGAAQAVASSSSSLPARSTAASAGAAVGTAVGAATLVEPEGDRTAGETHLRYDSVILATGFRHGLIDFLCTQDALLETSSAGAAEGVPIIDSRSRSTVIDSIYFVGMDQFQSTLSIGPLLGYRGYDVGAAIASELYGRPAKPLRFPSLPADEQDGSPPLLTPRRAAGVMAAGMAAGVMGSLLMSALRRTPPARPTQQVPRKLLSFTRRST